MTIAYRPKVVTGFDVKIGAKSKTSSMAGESVHQHTSTRQVIVSSTFLPKTKHWLVINSTSFRLCHPRIFAKQKYQESLLANVPKVEANIPALHCVPAGMTNWAKETGGTKPSFTPEITDLEHVAFNCFHIQPPLGSCDILRPRRDRRLVQASSIVLHKFLRLPYASML